MPQASFKAATRKALEAAIHKAFKKHANCVPINIFNVGKILDAGRAAAVAGLDVDAAVAMAVAKYRD